MADLNRSAKKMMRWLTILLFCTVGCAATPAEDFAKVMQLAKKVVALPASFGVDKKESDQMLAKRFPIGSSFDPVFQEVRAIRKAHRDCTEYFREPDDSSLSLSVYVYFDDRDSFGKEAVDFLFTFDETKKMKAVTYAQSSTAL